MMSSFLRSIKAAALADFLSENLISIYVGLHSSASRALLCGRRGHRFESPPPPPIFYFGLPGAHGLLGLLSNCLNCEYNCDCKAFFRFFYWRQIGGESSPPSSRRTSDDFLSRPTGRGLGMKNHVQKSPFLIGCNLREPRHMIFIYSTLVNKV